MITTELRVMKRIVKFEDDSDGGLGSNGCIKPEIFSLEGMVGFQPENFSLGDMVKMKTEAYCSNEYIVLGDNEPNKLLGL